MLLPIKKINEQPCSNGETIRHRVTVGSNRDIRTVHKQLFTKQTSPTWSRPHGHDRNLTLCVLTVHPQPPVNLVTGRGPESRGSGDMCQQTRVQALCQRYHGQVL
jgi:hypothetical protein